MRFLTAILALLPLCGAPALGASTDWYELAPDTRIRLIASGTSSADGKTLIALELDMPMNTKTYWQVPGETGIPTELDLSGSHGITGYRFIWPFPEIERLNGFTDFVYYGPTVIPIELDVESNRPVVEAAVLMGICSDICVPATAEFSLRLDLGTPDPGNDLRISQAVALSPIPWNGLPEPIGDVTYDATADAIHVAIDPAVVDGSSLIADASKSGHLIGAPQKSPEPSVVTLPLLGGNGEGLGAKPIHLVFMTRDGPFEVLRQIVP